MSSIWEVKSESYRYPTLGQDIEADVAVIGGGMTGITTAQLLAQRGLKVVILEANRVGVNNTGRSTGNLYSIVESFMLDLKDKYDEKVLHQILSSRKEAMDQIERNVFQYKIDCDFLRVPLIRYSAHPDMDEKIEREYEVLKELELDVEFLRSENFILKPLDGNVGVKLNHQLQFNPYRYVQQLANKLISDRFAIYENTRVIEIEEDHGVQILKTQNAVVHSKYIIEATHTPLGISAFHPLLGPYREYAVAAKLKEKLNLESILWGYYDTEELISLRTYQKEGSSYVMAVGFPHKVGQGDSSESFNCLRAFLNSHFSIDEISYEWAGQNYKPADLIPYIGRKGKKNIFIATGFSTHGLVYGTVAAKIIHDEIMEEENIYSKLYSTHRVTPIKSAHNFVKENLNVMKKYVEDYLNGEEASKLLPGDGIVVGNIGDKVAIHKDDEGKVHACSAVCPHMKCIVHWNKAEKTWDCPCHGSRFEVSGAAIEGPSFTGLPPV